MEPELTPEQKQRGERGPDKDPEQSKKARSNAAKLVQEKKRKDKNTNDKNRPGNNRPGTRPASPGPGPQPSRPGVGVPPSGPGGRNPTLNMEHDNETVKRTEEQKRSFRQNLVDIKEALPYYLQEYAEFLNNIAQWATGSADARIKISYPTLPDKTAKADAALLYTLIERHAETFIEKYPFWAGLFIFIKHTFLRAKIKIVDPETMRRANTNPAAQETSNDRQQQPPSA
jgi:hypothetical protein